MVVSIVIVAYYMCVFSKLVLAKILLHKCTVPCINRMASFSGDQDR